MVFIGHTIQYADIAIDLILKKVFMSIGFWQIIIVVALVVILFGRGKISELMGDVAKGVRSFKKGMKEDDESSEVKNVNQDSDNSDKKGTSQSQIN